MNKGLLKVISFFIFVFIAVVSSAREDFEDFLNSKEWKEMVARGAVYMETGMYGKALDYFKDVALNYPYIPEAQYYLGYVYYKKNDLDNAEKIFKRSLALDPANVPSLYYLALTYYSKGLYGKALGYLNEVVSYDPGFNSAYYNRGIIYLKLDRPFDAIKTFAYSVYLDPENKEAADALVKTYSIIKDEDLYGKNDSLPCDEKARGVSGRESPPGTGKIVEPYAKRSENMDMDVFVSEPGGHRQKIDPEQEQEILSTVSGKGRLEIIFGKPIDLRKKDLILDIKGGKGGEEVRVRIKDLKTRVCPGFYLKNIETVWGEKRVNIDRNAYMYVDTAGIKQITVELEPFQQEPEDSETKIWIKDIKIS